MPPELRPPSPPLRLRLDCDALAANWRALDALSGRARAGAAVKANAYGLGAARAVPVLRDAGCTDWFVAHWSEAAEIIGLVPPEQIAVLHGPMTADDASFARETGVRPVLNSLQQVQLWLESGGGLCDLMVDTGINRLGLGMAQVGDSRVGKLSIACCLSHLASADEDTAQNAHQLGRFAEVAATVRAGRYSLANSAGIALGTNYHFDLTRPGLALYGGVPRGELAGTIAPVAIPETAVIQVRDLQPGDSVGYNATFTAPRAMRIGIASVGYADGYLRCWSGKGAFRRNGALLPVVGRVSMDMAAVDLSAAPDCRDGDWLEIAYDLPEAAKVSGLSQYELLTSLGTRFSRK